MGAWIEIFLLLCNRLYLDRRTPRWVRGLKFVLGVPKWRSKASHPTMGAWIEIWLGVWIAPAPTVAPHDGCVD